MRRSGTVAGGLTAIITIGMMIFAYVQDRKERSLIASGQCEEREDAWYQPPPTTVCTMRSEDGHCLMWSQFQDDPYLRTWWVCQGGENFWRRKVLR